MTQPDLQPARVRLSRRRGWRMPPNTVRVARPGRWGNPYAVAEHGRERAIELFAGYLDASLARGLLDLSELRGRHLACWCPLDAACHADLLLARANSPAISC